MQQEKKRKERKRALTSSLYKSCRAAWSRDGGATPLPSMPTEPQIHTDRGKLPARRSVRGLSRAQTCADVRAERMNVLNDPP